MRAIIRKERERKMKNPPKDSAFRVRKNCVNSNKIARFKRDKGIDGHDIVMLDAGTLMHRCRIECISPMTILYSNSIGHQL